MKNFKNLFINSSKTTEQYCFIIDNARYYRFNGKYALYEQGVLPEKKEYAQRLGNSIETKQVYAIFQGLCPICGHQHENTPVVKPTNKLIVYCESCSCTFEPTKTQSIVSVLDIHTNQRECIDYEEIDIEMEEEKEQIVDFILDDDIQED
jgi:transcription elongation factor Elf1